MAKFKFRATNKWVDGTHNQAMIKDFYGAGKEDNSRTPTLFEMDEPPVLCGRNIGPNPVEYLLAALKGYRYGDVYYQTQGGRGTITQFVSQWKIKDGVAEATDCALATHHYRVALKGKLNLVNERYDNVIVALLDDKGCVQLKQNITGSFSAPQVGVVSAVESLADPILHLYRKTKRFVQGGKCEVFYNGAVEQPR